jgi:bifunctional pyridoxal-dependent enzyme with beta-cystathionase and maltose regulon repressor activities
MVKERNFHFILVQPKNPVGIDTRLQELNTIHYTGAKISQVLE